MAKCLFRGPFDRVHGRVTGLSGNGGQVVFSSPHGGNIVRGWVRPRNAQTVTQEANRARMTTIGKAYRALTAAQAAAWRDAATQIAKTNPLGLSYRLSGIGLFSAVNMYRLYDSQDLISTPPIDLTLPSPCRGFRHIGMMGTGYLEIEAYPDGLTNGLRACLRLSGALPGQAVQAIPQHCRLCTDPAYSPVASVSGDSLVWDFTPFDPHVSYGSRIGGEITMLSPEYLPGPSFFLGNRGVGITQVGLSLNYSFCAGTVSGTAGAQAVLDLSSSHRNGTASGPVWLPDSGLVTGGAFDFDGNQDYIAFSRITRADAQVWSCGAWVHSDSGGNWQVIFGDRADHDGLFGLHGGDDLMFTSVSGASVTKQLSAPYSGRTFHAVITCDGDKIYFFENGSPLGSEDPATTDFAPNSLGVKSLGVGEGFNGLMDEPFFFSRELSAAEVLALYNQGPMFPDLQIF